MFIFRTKTSMHSVIPSSAIETQVQAQVVIGLVSTCYSMRTQSFWYVFHLPCLQLFLHKDSYLSVSSVRSWDTLLPSHSWIYTGGITGFTHTALTAAPTMWTWKTSYKISFFNFKSGQKIFCISPWYNSSDTTIHTVDRTGVLMKSNCNQPALIKNWFVIIYLDLTFKDMHISF